MSKRKIPPPPKPGVAFIGPVPPKTLQQQLVEYNAALRAAEANVARTIAAELDGLQTRFGMIPQSIEVQMTVIAPRHDNTHTIVAFHGVQMRLEA